MKITPLEKAIRKVLKTKKAKVSIFTYTMDFASHNVAVKISNN